MIKRTHKTVSTISLPVNEKWTITRHRFSSGEGKRVCLVTGIHGNELLGQYVFHLITAYLENHPDSLNGTIAFYPMVNPLGLDLSERMIPFQTHLHMNRTFPGKEDGTPLECTCSRLFQDMLHADLVFDIHGRALLHDECYEVRLHAPTSSTLLPDIQSLSPDLFWIYPSLHTFETTLSGSLCAAGTPSVILDAGRSDEPLMVTGNRLKNSILSQLRSMGIINDDLSTVSTGDIPVIHSREEVERVSCSKPGIFVSHVTIGSHIRKGQTLGTIISATEASPLETILSPCSGLLFSQRLYSTVYPGTMLSRIMKQGD